MIVPLPWSPVAYDGFLSPLISVVCSRIIRRRAVRAAVTSSSSSVSRDCSPVFSLVVWCNSCAKRRFSLTNVSMRAISSATLTWSSC